MSASPLPEARGDNRAEPFDYIASLNLLVAICRALEPLPLEQMAAANEHGQTVGPILEPTAYMRGGGQNLYDQRRLIDAARRLQDVVRSLRPGSADA